VSRIIAVFDVLAKAAAHRKFVLREFHLSRVQFWEEQYIVKSLAEVSKEASRLLACTCRTSAISAWSCLALRIALYDCPASSMT
jgi:hypothetical protein